MVRHIRERFPDDKLIIDRLMDNDPKFLALCEDYDTCINALQYWVESKEPEAEIRINEYRNIAHQLVEEVVEILLKLKTH